MNLKCNGKELVQHLYNSISENKNFTRVSQVFSEAYFLSDQKGIFIFDTENKNLIANNCNTSVEVVGNVISSLVNQKVIEKISKQTYKIKMKEEIGEINTNLAYQLNFTYESIQ
jgi:precorrin-6B methylase 2